MYKSRRVDTLLSENETYSYLTSINRNGFKDYKSSTLENHVQLFLILRRRSDVWVGFWLNQLRPYIADQTLRIHKTAVLSASSKYCSKTYCQTCRQMLEFNEGSPNKQRACNILLNGMGDCCEKYMTRALSTYHT